MELIDGLIDEVIRELPGSYGLIYERDDETTEPPGRNAFKVTVLARGALSVRMDPFLSPAYPVIEDPYADLPAGERRLNATNSVIAERVVSAIDAFAGRVIGLGDLQSRIQSASDLVERDGSGIAELLRLAEADLEKIQYAVLGEEQYPRALARVGALRRALEAL